MTRQQHSPSSDSTATAGESTSSATAGAVTSSATGGESTSSATGGTVTSSATGGSATSSATGDAVTSSATGGSATSSATAGDVDARPVVFGRLLPGAAGESRRVVHVFEIPAGLGPITSLTAYCGEVYGPGELEQVRLGVGMPCERCLICSRRPRLAAAGG